MKVCVFPDICWCQVLQQADWQMSLNMLCPKKANGKPVIVGETSATAKACRHDQCPCVMGAKRKHTKKHKPEWPPNYLAVCLLACRFSSHCSTHFLSRIFLVILLTVKQEVRNPSTPYRHRSHAYGKSCSHQQC